jgi:hypothetical protein
MVDSSRIRGSKIWRTQAARAVFELAGNPSSMGAALQTVVKRLLDGVTCPPTDLDAVACKVRVSRCVPDDIAGSGELRREGSDFVIAYSQYLPVSRRRFTIAHEIGHAFFEVTWGNLPKPGKEVERLCDMLAAEILMPREVLAPFIDRHLSLQAVRDVARAFRVSLSSAAIRCAEFKGAISFEVQANRVVWGSGIAKRGPLAKLDESLQTAIATALDGRDGPEDLYFDSAVGLRPWCLEHIRLKDNRALFLLQPFSRHPPITDRITAI